jgi:hypothetical protein
MESTDSNTPQLTQKQIRGLWQPTTLLFRAYLARLFISILMPLTFNVK